jgi:hypothetical protein
VVGQEVQVRGFPAHLDVVELALITSSGTRRPIFPLTVSTLDALPRTDSAKARPRSVIDLCCWSTRDPPICTAVDTRQSPSGVRADLSNLGAQSSVKCSRRQGPDMCIRPARNRRAHVSPFWVIDGLPSPS